MPLTKLSPWHARIKIYANIFRKECDEIETNFLNTEEIQGE